MTRFCIIALILTTHVFAAESPTGGVVSKSKSLPPKEGVWHGDAPHLFFGGQAALFCGSHGTFSGGFELPQRRGEVRTIRYRATFKGELQLKPPLAQRPQKIAIDEPILMTERVISQGKRDEIQRFTTELIAVTFRGSGLPQNVSIRESPRRRSMGKASIATGAPGSHRIQSVYEVWLEISMDGGKTWQVADNAVTMSLMPDVKTAKPAAIRKNLTTPERPTGRATVERNR